MNENVKIIFGLVGGLAMFLYGMNNMSDALQKAAGEKMKKILSFLTKNPIMGALAGALVTAVLQSSSATTVMVIGFVSAGLMSLPQAISVIFGANIGTTMTAQLMAFKISNYIYPIIFIGFILFFVCKREQIKNIGMVIFSFGLLFEGIEIMGGVMKPLAGSPIFTDLMGKVAEIPVLGILLGAVMTVVVQSSSATIAVLQNFASQAGPDEVTSVIGLAGAIPILLGDNIGTTITALLASIGQSKNAKRTAIAHSVFNISGSILFAFLIPLLAKFVQFISPKGNEVDVIARQIANAHTTFNIACTIIWLPLISLMVKIVTFIVKGEDKNVFSESKPRFLDEKIIGQPVAAMYLVSEEIRRFSEFGTSLLYKTRALFESGNSDVVRSDFSRDYGTVKSLHDSISSYITKMLSSGNLTESQSEQTAGLLFVTNNIERISDRCFDMSEVLNKLSGKKKVLSKAAVSELGECFD
ncbi:MAG: Na/Pi cotransporter family protein, partial [Oscillospiraceae bacterium]